MFLPLLTLSSMLGLAVSNNCPNEWIHYDTSCYHFSHDTESMPVADLVCQHMGGHLVEIETAAENAYLAAKANGLKAQFWTGLSDIQQESVWVWYGSERPLSSTGFQNWAPNEPNNSGMNENCAVIRTDGTWNDGPCHLLVRYICEKNDESSEIVG
ncbi:low affinity immunoglobulin epsilon Fc receptor-like [Mercenaria mercenaria]|uniref:low affinity immunoglobulin epsilon Fc receptor-like n=1 Tax=Mercenaria mercenaria TaxID=6596 RepID=UPI00234E5204|nr:low affinity immunoglobulin epsilon Fc receptor-like [Mercenaria mercenaria]